MKSIYLDYAAATPLSKNVLAVMQPYFATKAYNPSATYLAGKSVRHELEAARAQVAEWLGVRPATIVFTAGGTEANNLAIKGVMDANPDGHLIVSAIEHESVLKPAENYPHALAPVGAAGIVDVVQLERLIQKNTVLISIMYANNEVGSIQPLKAIAELVKKIKHQRQKAGNSTPLYFHTDACQAANYLDLHAVRLGVDMMTLNGGKIYGPKQSGILYVNSTIPLRPLIEGGGQENGLRSGTENVAASIGFAAALEETQKARKKESNRLRALQKLFFETLSQEISSAVINGSEKHRLPNNVHITIPDQDNEILMIKLDETGIQCAVGSACSASSEEPSHVLEALGLPEKDIRASLRFTMGRGTTAANVRSCVKALAAAIRV